MKMEIRKARLEDASAFLEIKNQLPLTRSDGSMTTGGFLLGTDLATYRQYIEEAHCLVAEVEGQVVGFGIVLDDAFLRQTDIWTRRHEVQWAIPLAEYEARQLCYFEQLAFLPGHRRLVFRLAYNLLKWAFEAGGEYLLTTTVREPILNLAAVPFIEAVQGTKVGEIDEVYPLVGRIRSDIYLFSAEQFFIHTQNHALYPFLAAHTQQF